jgi:hypothetical protein
MIGIGKEPMNPDRSHQTRDAERSSERPTAVVVALPTAGRRFRRPDDDAPRGAIVLFTGVRYERMPDAEAPRLRRRS